MIGACPRTTPVCRRAPAGAACSPWGFGAVAAMSLAACGIRLEDDAPRVPLIPTRAAHPGRVVPAGPVAAQRRPGRAGHLAGRGGDRRCPRGWRRCTAARSTVLEAELLRLGVPRKVLDTAAAGPRPRERPRTGTATGHDGTATGLGDGSATPSAGSTAPATTAPSAGPQGAGRRGGRATSGRRRSRRWRPCPRRAIPLVGSVLGPARRRGDPAGRARDLARAHLVGPVPGGVLPRQHPRRRLRLRGRGSPVAAPAPSTPSRWPPSPPCESRAQDQESLAGASAGPPALGYPLPFPVTTAGDGAQAGRPGAHRAARVGRPGPGLHRRRHRPARRARPVAGRHRGPGVAVGRPARRLPRAHVTRPEDVAPLVPEHVPRLRPAVLGAATGPSAGRPGADWSARLPRLLAEVLDDWGLEPLGVGAHRLDGGRRAGHAGTANGWPSSSSGRTSRRATSRWCCGTGTGGARSAWSRPTRAGAPCCSRPWTPTRDLDSVDVDAACQVDRRSCCAS